MLNFDRFTVKHGTQNIQNDCHQQLSDSIRVHKIRFRQGSALDPTGGANSAPPDHLAGLRGTSSKGEGEGREKGKGEGKGRGNEGETPAPFLDPPLNIIIVCHFTPVNKGVQPK